MKEFLT